MTTATSYEHIVIDSERGAVISGTTVKVIELVLDAMAYGWSPEELHFQYPHLSMGRIHSALAYYHDHREAMDAEIARREADAAKLRAQARHAPLQQRLRR